MRIMSRHSSTTSAAGSYVGLSASADSMSSKLPLRTTFGDNARANDAAVSFWGFRAPLGAWVAIWGCFAMVSSAPFDNWWHDAYGLDVRIISPPHTVLALGIAGGLGLLYGAVIPTTGESCFPTSSRLIRFARIIRCKAAASGTISPF